MAENPDQNRGGQGKGKQGQSERGPREVPETPESIQARREVQGVINGLEGEVRGEIDADQVSGLVEEFQTQSIVPAKLEEFDRLVQEGKIDEALELMKDTVRPLFTENYGTRLSQIQDAVNRIITNAHTRVEGTSDARGPLFAVKAPNTLGVDFDAKVKSIRDEVEAMLQPLTKAKNRIDGAVDKANRRKKELEADKKGKKKVEDIRTDLAMALAEHRTKLESETGGTLLNTLIERYNRSTTSRMVAGFGTTALMTIPGFQHVAVALKTALAAAGGAAGADALNMGMMEGAAIRRVASGTSLEQGAINPEASDDDIAEAILAGLREAPEPERKQRVMELLGAYGELTKISSIKGQKISVEIASIERDEARQNSARKKSFILQSLDAVRKPFQKVRDVFASAGEKVVGGLGDFLFRGNDSDDDWKVTARRGMRNAGRIFGGLGFAGVGIGVAAATGSIFGLPAALAVNGGLAVLNGRKHETHSKGFQYSNVVEGVQKALGELSKDPEMNKILGELQDPKAVREVLSGVGAGVVARQNTARFAGGVLGGFMAGIIGHHRAAAAEHAHGTAAVSGSGAGVQPATNHVEGPVPTDHPAPASVDGGVVPGAAGGPVPPSAEGGMPGTPEAYGPSTLHTYDLHKMQEVFDHPTHDQAAFIHQNNLPRPDGGQVLFNEGPGADKRLAEQILRGHMGNAQYHEAFDRNPQKLQEVVEKMTRPWHSPERGLFKDDGSVEADNRDLLTHGADPARGQLGINAHKEAEAALNAAHVTHEVPSWSHDPGVDPTMAANTGTEGPTNHPGNMTATEIDPLTGRAISGQGSSSSYVPTAESGFMNDAQAGANHIDTVALHQTLDSHHFGVYSAALNPENSSTVNTALTNYVHDLDIRCGGDPDRMMERLEVLRRGVISGPQTHTSFFLSPEVSRQHEEIARFGLNPEVLGGSEEIRKEIADRIKEVGIFLTSDTPPNPPNNVTMVA